VSDRRRALSLLGRVDIMRTFRRGPLSNVGTNYVSVARTSNRARDPAVIEMIAVSRGAICLILQGIALLAAVLAGAALAQVPIPVQEQIRLFNSMSPAQQQALIREMQRSLPPAQRQAIIGLLQGDGDAEGAAEDLDPDTEATLRDAIDAQNAGEEGLGDTEVPRLEPGDTMVIQFQSREDDPRALLRTAEEQEELMQFLDRLEEANPYELDDDGRLYLPGVPAIPLAGLDVDQATVRVQAETALRPFTIIVTFLPLEPVGRAALEPFGYDLFERSRRAFLPQTDVPVPADYVIGPGDTINIQLFGSQNNEFFLDVSRDGTINFPEIGPVNVSGLTFEQMRDTLNQRVTEQMIGVRASITLGELRSIRVFLLGDVVRPGSYSVSGLSTITNALYAGGGVERIGSLRNIALRRDDMTVSTLDLYDLLLRGDTSGDARLQAGDAIFVPPVGAQVTVDGEVRRPAIYEVKDEETVAELIALAGGLNATANRGAVRLERVVPNRGTTVQDVDLARGAGAETAVRDGDVLRIPPNLAQLENSVRLAGNVFQPGLYQWREGMRLTDLVPAPERVKPMSDLNYVLIRRELSPNVEVAAVSADLQSAWRQPSGAANVLLQPRDTVYVFHVETGRQEFIAPLVEELEMQAASHAALPVVRIGGQVRAPGEYPLEPGMRVSDLIRAGGGLSEAAYATEAELARYAVIDGEYRETELLTVDLAALLRGAATANIVVGPYDYLNIKEVSRWRGEESVTIRGEVVFPGTYPIRRGERLSSLLARAGGLTDLAFPAGSVFTRVEIQQRQREQLEQLAQRVERDLAAISISDPSASATITAGQALIDQLRNSVATGRWVIRLDNVVAGEDAADVVLKDGDTLLVPDERQEVSVLGEVQYATSHVYEPRLTRDEYINRSGGLSQRADRKRIYVVRANGEVVANTGGGWFQMDGGSDVRPGDSIVVPVEVDQPLARWSAITQIIYNLAIAAAAVNSF
jgi:polysaccharide biosynthesis/export protein